jgi:hypothetical protein
MPEDPDQKARYEKGQRRAEERGKTPYGLRYRGGQPVAAEYEAQRDRAAQKEV